MTMIKKEKTRINEKTKIKIVKRRHPKGTPYDLWWPTLTPQPPKPSIKQLSNRSSVIPEKEEHRPDTFMTILGHEDQDTLDDTD